jgi:hypothetical protein
VSLVKVLDLRGYLLFRTEEILSIFVRRFGRRVRGLILLIRDEALQLKSFGILDLLRVRASASMTVGQAGETSVDHAVCRTGRFHAAWWPSSTLAVTSNDRVRERMDRVDMEKNVDDLK